MKKPSFDISSRFPSIVCWKKKKLWNSLKSIPIHRSLSNLHLNLCFLAGARDLFLLQSVQSDFGSHPVSCPVGAGGSFAA